MLTLAAVWLLAIGPAKAEPSVWGKADLTLAGLPALSVPTCGWCGNCSDPGRHDFARDDENGPDDSNSEGSHDCDDSEGAGSCSIHLENPGCFPMLQPVAQLDFAGKQRLWALLVLNEGREADLPAELAELGEAVVFNASRGAIQVHGGCDGSLITMSIPLNRAQIAQLD